MRTIRHFFETYERHISSAFLLGGFIIDTLTLRRVDLFFGNVVLISYITLATIGIALLHIHAAGRLRIFVFRWIPLVAPFAIQFAFGGLFSAFLIFYFRSAAIGVSWPFVLVIALLFIGNELFKKYYSRLVFNVSILYFCYFSFLILYVPLIISRLGMWVFVLSGALSLCAIWIFVHLLELSVPVLIKKAKPMLMVSIGGIYLTISALYFLNIIPPIPLSLKYIGVYQSVVRESDGFHLFDQKKQHRWLELRDTIAITDGSPVYVFSSVFAPTALNTKIIHHWQQFDPDTKTWVTSFQPRFDISGGRDGGYRAYSVKSNVAPGLWRVDVETSGGQIVGRITFEVELVDTPVVLHERVY